MKPPISAPERQEVLFIEDRHTNNVPPRIFTKGQFCMLTLDAVDYWLSRGAITIDPEEIAAAKAAAAPKLPVPQAAPPMGEPIPGNWKFLKADDKIALAVKLGAADDVTAEHASTVIAAEADKRAKA